MYVFVKRKQRNGVQSFNGLVRWVLLVENHDTSSPHHSFCSITIFDAKNVSKLRFFRLGCTTQQQVNRTNASRRVQYSISPPLLSIGSQTIEKKVLWLTQKVYPIDSRRERWNSYFNHHHPSPSHSLHLWLPLIFLLTNSGQNCVRTKIMKQRK